MKSKFNIYQIKSNKMKLFNPFKKTKSIQLDNEEEKQLRRVALKQSMRFLFIEMELGIKKAGSLIKFINDPSAPIDHLPINEQLVIQNADTYIPIHSRPIKRKKSREDAIDLII